MCLLLGRGYLSLMLLFHRVAEATESHHRDQARMYVKQAHAGEGELPLSPEEEEAVRMAVDPADAAP